MTKTKPLAHIEHVIVLMFENRSFDNVLGDLYPNDKSFNGISNKDACPYTDPSGYTTMIPPWTTESKDARIMPAPDPCEEYEDMKAQIADGTMQGFAQNYAVALQKVNIQPTVNNIRQIMQYYRRYTIGRPGNMPITSQLAKSYAVSDTYFGSGPVQTWPNRLFAHCGTPGYHHIIFTDEYKSYLNNTEYPEHDIMYGNVNFRSIFQQLDEKHGGANKNNWRVYYDGTLPISSIVEYVNKHFNRTVPGGNVSDFETTSHIYTDFFKDLKADKLPKYSFIEPRYQTHTHSGSVPPNSNHPGSVYVTGNKGKGPFINVLYGELMLQKIFNALVAQPEIFKKTLLMVTYDEHGGLFDHEPPPPAVSPFPKEVLDRMTNFTYDQYGPRVPAIFINPYIHSETVLRPPEGSYFDHTSIIATLRDQFDIPDSLTNRVANAPTFTGLIDPHIKELNFGPEDMYDVAELLKDESFPADIERPTTIPERYLGDIAAVIYNTAFLNEKTRIGPRE